MVVPQKIKNKLPYNMTIPLLGIHTKDLKARPQRNICLPMFAAALFTIAKRWKQPTCPSMDEWINKIWYIRTMEYYYALKRKEMLTCYN
uniref:Uncharacterized protein n=1 Tax=Equus caballus TaxID=9796 RepID=A0A9L0RBF2_HORSE